MTGCAKAVRRLGLLFCIDRVPALNRRIFWSAWAVLGGIFATSAWSAGEADHPLLKRFPGFEVVSAKTQSFEVVTVPANEVFQVSGKKYVGPLSFEGKVTELNYSNAGTSAAKPSKLEVYRNYLAAITQLGGKQLNTPPQEDLNGSSTTYDWHIFQINQPGKAPVSVLFKIPYEHAYTLLIVEHQKMVDKVLAGELANQIKAAGFATVYINFDTNRAELKPDGQEVVKEIAQMLRNDPNLKLSIEGHTDNVGTPASNKTLSAARAAAVLKAVTGLGIAPARLKAVGHGQDVPVADNRSEDGRAKNRRVELVRMP